MDKNKYIVVQKAPIGLSQITLDCKLDSCVPTRKGELLSSVLEKICAKIPASTVVPQPVDQVNADWNATEGPAMILNKPNLSSSALFNKKLTGIQDGQNRLFATPSGFSPTSTRIFVNGARMELDVDYQEVGTTEILFLFDPIEEDSIIIDYNT